MCVVFKILYFKLFVFKCVCVVLQVKFVIDIFNFDDYLDEEDDFLLDDVMGWDRDF